MNDEIVEYLFYFIIGPTRFPLNAKKEQKRKPTTTNIGIKRKLGMLVVETFQSHVVEGNLISENIEGNVEEPMHKQPRVGISPSQWNKLWLILMYWQLGNIK